MISAPGRRARLVVAAAITATAALYVVPYGALIGYPLVLMSTLAHEMGHGLAAWLVGARFEELVVHPDGSGVARLSGSFSRLGSAFVSAGGLVGPAVLGGLFFVLAARGRLARAGLLVFGAFLVALTVWVVRSWFGLLFVGAVGVACVVVALRSRALVAQGALALLAAQLALSVFSRGDYLFTDTAVTWGGATQKSDVAAMAEALWLPYWFWGALCGAVSVAVLAAGTATFWRATASPPVSERTARPATSELDGTHGLV